MGVRVPLRALKKGYVTSVTLFCCFHSVKKWEKMGRMPFSNLLMLTRGGAYCIILSTRMEQFLGGVCVV